MPAAAAASAPAWIGPGARATLVWVSPAVERPGGPRLYEIAGPVLAEPPAWPYFVLAPAEAQEFAGRVYAGLVGLQGLRGFLRRCTLARAALGTDLAWVAPEAEAPLLPALEAWSALAERPVAPYHREIEAFLPDDRPLHARPEVIAAARRHDELFRTAWVCEECGDPADAAVFLWTRRRGARVRVCLLIENDAGVWTCRLHPFDLCEEPA